MSNRRIAKVAAAVRQVVSNAVLFELRDPRVTGVTILNVEVAADLRTAKVFISILGTEKSEKLTLMGLNAARGWIQSRIAEVLDLRLTPVLTFVVDPGIKKSIEMAKILRELNPPSDDEEDLGEGELGDSEDAETEEESTEDNESEGDLDSEAKK